MGGPVPRAAVRASSRRDNSDNPLVSRGCFCGEEREQFLGSRAVGGAGGGWGPGAASRRQRDARGRCWAKVGSALVRRDA